MKTREDIANDLYGYCLEHIPDPPTLDEVKVNLLFFSTIIARDGEPETIPEDQRAGYMAGQKAALREIFNDLTQIVTNSLNHDEPAGADLLEAVRSHAAAYIECWKDTDPVEVIKQARGEMTAILRAVREAPKGSKNIPTGPVLDLIHDFLGSSGDLKTWEENKAIVSHSGKYEIETNGGAGRRITRTAENGIFSLEIADISKFTGSNSAAEKIFMYTLMEAARQSIHNGELIREQVNFSLDDLVNSGCYESRNAARAGFWTGKEALELLKVAGYVKLGKEEKQISLKSAHSRTLFIGGDVDENQCTMLLNPFINWSAVAPFFALIPDYYFRLSARAKSLVYYIFFLARQRTKEIEEKGYFTISLRAIQERLNLPHEGTTRNPGRDIRDEIDKVLEEIEGYNTIYYPKKQFNLLLIYHNKGQKRFNAADYYNRGKLKVSFSGELAEGFINLSKNRKKKIEAAQRKQARIEEKMAAIKKAKST